MLWVWERRPYCSANSAAGTVGLRDRRIVLKAIMVMFDSLNRHMLPPYGGTIKAPNFTRLAERCTTFDNSYVGSMPCIPARRELHTGRYNFLHRSWGPIEPFDDSMPEILGEHGIHAHLATDHQHYWEDGGATYHTRYKTWEFMRGQEGDPWKAQLRDPPMPPRFKGGNPGARLLRQDLVNRQYMATEDLHPQTRTFDAGLEFIRENSAADRWFLQIESFDPHEPFFSYARHREPYREQLLPINYDWPSYEPVGTDTAEEIRHVRAEYSALVSMCDYSLGRVLDLMDELDLWGDTLLIVCTDHGFLLGEHGWWAKTVQPWFNEIARTPLFVWDPRSRRSGVRRSALVQMIDFAPTLLEFFGVQPRPDMQGAALRDTVDNDRPVRRAALFGSFGGHVNITDGRFVYMRTGPDAAAVEPLYEYTLMPTHMRRRFGIDELQDLQLGRPFSFTKGVRPLRVPGQSFGQSGRYGTMLFDLQCDPGQIRAIVDESAELWMIGLLLDLLRESDAPDEQYDRLGLPRQGEASSRHLLSLSHQQLARGAQLD